MSSDSELSVDGPGSSDTSSSLSNTTDLKKKRKRGIKINLESSDLCSSPDMKNKKTKVNRKVKCVNKSSDEDELNTSSTDEPTGIINVCDVSKNEEKAIQQRKSDTDSYSDHDVKASASKVGGEKCVTNVASSVSDSSTSDYGDSNMSEYEKSSKLLNSSLTDPGKVNVKRKQKKRVLHRKKKVNKAELLLEIGKSIDSSDDENDGKSKCSVERHTEKDMPQIETHKAGKQSQLRKKRRSEKGKSNASDDEKNGFISERSDGNAKKLENKQHDSDSELSGFGESKPLSPMRVDENDLKIQKKARPSKSIVNSTKEAKKLPRSKSSKVTTNERKSSSDSDSDSGLEGSDNDRTSEKMKNNEILKSKVQSKNLSSSSGSESESIIKKHDKYHVDQKHSSASSSDSDPDEKNRKNVKYSAPQRSFSSNDKQKSSNSHTISSSDSDSEVDSKQSQGKKVKGEEIKRNKPDKDVDKQKKRKPVVEDPHKDRSVMRAKRYLKEAGLRIQNYTSLWAGCRSNKARVKTIIAFLQENGLSGTPTLEKCKRLRIKREKKNEASELDLTNIITTGRESRRSSVLMQKPVKVDSPTKQDIKNRFARIQALGDSDSSSE